MKWPVPVMAALLVAGVCCEYPEEAIPTPTTPEQEETPLGVLTQINAPYQICNPSVSQDTVNYSGCMLWLGFQELNVVVPESLRTVYGLAGVQLHDRLTVTDRDNNLRWFLMRDSVPGVTGELQDPEWGTHPDYIAFLGKDGGGMWDGFVVRLSDKRMLKFSENGLNETSTPHVWVGDTVGAVAPAPSGVSRYGSGLLPRDSIYEYFHTTDVKFTYSRVSGSWLDLYMVDYSCDTCDSIVPIRTNKPEGRDEYKVESALISPDGNWVTYNCYVLYEATESYAQRLRPGSKPQLVAALGADPHWWYYNGRQYIIYSTVGGVVSADLMAVSDGSAGRTQVQEVSVSAGGPQFIQFSMIGQPRQLLHYPFKGGISPDGYYMCTGYRMAYMFAFN